MKETGKLDVITGRKMRLHLIRLFERTLICQDLNAAYYDELLYNPRIANFTPYWSFTQKKPIRQGRESLEILENALMLILDTSKFYVEQLENDFRYNM